MKIVTGMLFWLLIGSTVAVASPQPDTIDLLPLAVLESGLATAETEDQSQFLRDGEAGTVAEFAVMQGGPVDLVFYFADGIVAPEKLIVTLPAPGDGPAPALIDVLVSTISPTSGFRSLRTEAIDALAPSVEIGFRSASARWVMVRLYPAQGAAELAVAELALLGATGAPETVYEFGTTPVDAVKVIESLSGLTTGSIGLEDDERVLFASAGRGSFSTDDFEQAALLASGVRDPAQRDAYRNQIAKLEADAREVIDLNAPTVQSGAQLLNWLHETLLTGGYAEGQTNLDGVLDGGVFNCVSSAVIYVALGQRLGLDVRAIEVPDHAFAIVYDGVEHMDVETTTQGGFNPLRDRVDAFEALTGFNYIPQSNKAQRREIGMAGLAALIYYNHGVIAIREARYYDALLANFRAMSLDPEFASAVTNALATLGKWSGDLADKGRWDDAVRVAAVGAGLAPDDDGLAALELSIWQRWAIDEIDAGRAQDALGVLRQAAAAVPEGGFGAMQAMVLIRPAETLIDAADWEAALATTSPDGLKLDPDALAELDEWRRGLFLRWADTDISAQRYTQAAAVMERGLGEYPGDRRLMQTAAYLAQEGARAAATYGEGLAFLASMMRQFPGIAEINDVAESFVERAIADGTTAPSLEAGVAHVAEALSLFRDPQTQARLGALVYEVHGHPLMVKGDWEAAAAIYAVGRRKFPDDTILTANARYLAQGWQREALSTGGPEALAGANQKLRELFPDFAAQDGFGEAEIKRQIAELTEAGAFDEADAVLDGAQLVLSTDSYVDLATYVISRRANVAMSAGDWVIAAEIYAAGLSRFPGDEGLSRNIAYVAQEWTRTAEAGTGVEGVIAAMQSLSNLFPDDKDVASMGVTTLRRAVLREVEADRPAAARTLVAAAASLLSQDDSRALTITFFEAAAQPRIDARDWAGALASYVDGLAIHPDAEELSRNLSYVIQEWTTDALGNGGPDGFVAAALTVQALLPDHPETVDVLESVLASAAKVRLADGNAEGAVALIDEVSRVLSAGALQNLKVFIYDHWARSVGETGDWTEAAAIYQRGIAELGNVGLLENNRNWALSQIK